MFPWVIPNEHGDYLNLFSHPKRIPLLTTMNVLGSEHLLPTLCTHPGCEIKMTEYWLVYIYRQTLQKDGTIISVLYIPVKPYNTAIRGMEAILKEQGLTDV